MWKTNSAASTQTVIAHSPRTKFGASLPMMNSTMLTGVASSASIVPRSHSRATTSAVSSAPIIIWISAIEPGTRKRRLSSSGLNQTRDCTSMPAGAGAPAARRFWSSHDCQAPWM